MVIFSMVMNTLAPLMTSIQERFSISVAVSSILPFISTLGTMISNFVGGFFIAQIGYNFFIIGAIIIQIVGLILFAFAVNFPMIVIAVFLLGFATGGVFLTLTSSYSHLDGKYQNFGIYNAFFGFGGIFAPLLVSLFLRLNLDFRFIYFFHLVLAIVILIWVLSLKPIPNIRYETIKFKEALNIISNKFVYLSLLIFLLYSGTEIGIITWSGNLFYNVFNYSKEFSSIVLSLFWIVFTFGRLLTEFLNKKFTELGTIIYFSSSVIISIALLLIFKHYIFFLFVGFSLSAIFPTIQKYTNQHLPKKWLGMYNGLAFGSTGVGAMIISTSMGVVGERNFVISYLIPFITFALIILAAQKLRIEKAPE
jgi:fucose permease